MYARLARGIVYLVATASFLYSGFFDNSTMYGSVSMGTPYIGGNDQVDDDYIYSLGLRKIALFPYQSRDSFYNGSEEELSDNALFGAVEVLDYLF